jgi:Trk K+ transport system NAD-binding subunit
LVDLEILNIHQAKSIIIIAPESKDPDSIVIKTILAITNNPNRKKDTKYHIVAEIRDPRNVAIAEIAGKDEVQLVIFDYLISRITAQTCRQPGLSVVFNELLDFSGDEIYFQEEPALVGKTFIEAMFSYETSVLIGIRKKNGKILLKPAYDTLIEEGDLVIAICEDDDTIKLSGRKEFNINTDAIRKNVQPVEPSPETTLIIGWNRRAHLIINELDNYVYPGSRITVISENTSAESDLTMYCSDLQNQTVTFWFGDTTNRRILDDLNIETYNHIIVLSQTENSDIQASDARTLSTLLHLRDIADTKGHEFSIVSEMLDDRNRELAEITNTDDFIVSVKLDSLMLSQISENKELKTIFENLFSAGGPSIYIRPAENYVELGRAVNFYTIMESARQQGHLAIGVKMKNSDASFHKQEILSHGVVVNPNKSTEVFFSKGDKIIILSEDDVRDLAH